MALIAVGGYTQHPSTQMVGYLILFLGGGIILASDIEIQDGTNKTTHYQYFDVNNTQLANTTQTETIAYADYTDATFKTIGFFLTLSGLFGIVEIIFKIKSFLKPKEADDD